MRAPIAPALLRSLALFASGACSPGAAPGPVAPSTPSLVSRGAADAADAAMKSKHVHGTLEAMEAGALQPGTTLVVRRLVGEGTASHLGRFTVAGSFTRNLATATGGGSATYTAANGDAFTGTVTGRAVVAAGIATVTEAVAITGGTGRFAGAAGTLTVVRRVVHATAALAGTIDGTITLSK